MFSGFISFSIHRIYKELAEGLVIAYMENIVLIVSVPKEEEKNNRAVISLRRYMGGEIIDKHDLLYASIPFNTYIIRSTC